MLTAFEDDRVLLSAADFFTTEVCTPRGSVTYSTLFVLNCARRVHVLARRFT